MIASVCECKGMFEGYVYNLQHLPFVFVFVNTHLFFLLCSCLCVRHACANMRMCVCEYAHGA